MAKTEVQEKGRKDAGLVVNNAFIEGLTAQLAEKAKWGLSFPADYNYANELMGAYLVLQETLDKDKKPVLQSCSQASIAKTLMDMVTLGLSMQKRQCYPVAYAGKLQCQVSVYGNTCIARRFGMKSINAICIYAGDDFSYHIEDAKIVIDRHTQDFMNIDTGKVAGAYAVVTMNDETKYTELMNIDMIRQSWKQGFGYKDNGGTHQKFTDQMAMKTVKNRALKYIIRTYGTQLSEDAYESFEEAESADRVLESQRHDLETKANKIPFMGMDDASPMEETQEAVVYEREAEPVPVAQEAEQDGEQLEIPFAV